MGQSPPRKPPKGLLLGNSRIRGSISHPYFRYPLPLFRPSMSLTEPRPCGHPSRKSVRTYACEQNQHIFRGAMSQIFELLKVADPQQKSGASDLHKQNSYILRRGIWDIPLCPVAPSQAPSPPIPTPPNPIPAHSRSATPIARPVTTRTYPGAPHCVPQNPAAYAKPRAVPGSHPGHSTR